MVVNDKIELEFKIVNKASAELSKVSNDIKVFKSNINDAKSSVDGFDKVVNRISFQTATQGLLNMSTSAAQVYTSFSNLDRAANQVQSSLVAVHKAEDQIHRKQIQLNQAIEKYGSDSQKAAMISSELATAQEQLAVKEERHKLAVDQLNDTYILMASNLANTVFGSIQTLNSILSASQKATLLSALTVNGHTLSLKLNSFMLNQNMRAYMGNSAAVKLNALETKILSGMTMFDTQVKKASTFATIQSTIATNGLGQSLKMLMSKIPVIGLALVGITTAYELYEMNVGGVKDAINKLLGIQSIEQQMEADRKKSLEEFNELMGDSVDVRERMFNSTVKLHGISNIIKDEMEAMTKATKSYQQSMNDTMAQQQSMNITRTSPSSMARSNINGLNQTPTTGIVIPNIKNINPMAAPTATDPYAQLRIKLEPFETSYEIRKYGEAFASEISNILGDEINLENIEKLIGYNKEALDIAYKINDINKEQYDIEMKALDFAKQKLSTEKDITNESQKQRDNAKAILELKKKLSLEYGFTSPGSERRRFVEGETGYYTGRDSVPFAGLINKKTNEIIISHRQRIDFKRVDSLLEISKKRIESGAWTLNEARDYLNTNIKKMNLGRNIIGIPALTGIAEHMTTAISGYTNRLRSEGILSDIGGRFSDMQTWNPITKSYTTTGQFFRDTALQFSAGRLSTASMVNKQGFTQAGLNAIIKARLNYDVKGNISVTRGQISPIGQTAGRSVAMGGSQSKGRSSKHGGANRADEYNAQMAYNRAVAGMEGISELTGISLALTATFPAERGRSYRPIYHFDDLYKRIAEANARVSLGNQIIGLGAFDPDVVSTDIYKIPSEQLVGILQREQSQVEAQRIKIGATTAEVTSLRGSYYGHDELLDRVRFVDKLAQISTGATVI